MRRLHPLSPLHLSLRRRSLPHSRRPFSTSPPPSPLTLAIIGSGPSGFYTASRLLSLLPAHSHPDIRVDMYERLPTPYGLVRYGVAPDHPEVKNCQHKFDELSADRRFTFLGNILVGGHSSASPSSHAPTSASSSSSSSSTYTYPHALPLPLPALLPHYTHLLLTSGASLPAQLPHVPGSSSSSSPLANVFPALSFVSWYNSHPAFAHLRVSLHAVEEVQIVGHGNVALDVARLLLKRPADLADTDLSEEVLGVLRESAVRRVSVVGRRGPGQVSFTTKEFREMVNLPGVSYRGIDQDLASEAKGMVQGDRMKTRLLGLMEKPNDSSASDGREFSLGFLKSPKAFVPRGSKGGVVGEVEWTTNELLSTASEPPSPPPPSQAASVPGGRMERAAVIARPTGETVRERADMIVESVGYRSEPVGDGEMVPFDLGRGRFRNVGGRIVDDQGVVVPGMYVAGWAARGPVGVIASTMHDAYATASLIISDHYESSADRSGSLLASSAPEPGWPDAVERGVREGKVVDLQGWAKIDEAERERAKQKGLRKEREKFRTVEDMLAVLA